MDKNISNQIKDNYNYVKDNNSNGSFSSTLIWIFIFTLLISFWITIFFSTVWNNSTWLNSGEIVIDKEEDGELREIKNEIRTNIIFMKKVSELYTQIEKE